MEPDKLRSDVCLTGMKECKDIAATEIGPKSGPAKSEHANIVMTEVTSMQA